VALASDKTDGIGDPDALLVNANGNIADGSCRRERHHCHEHVWQAVLGEFQSWPSLTVGAAFDPARTSAKVDDRRSLLEKKVFHAGRSDAY
jgi:hypothetical protein